MKKTDTCIGRMLLLAFVTAVLVLLVQRMHWLPDFGNWFKAKPALIDNTPLVIKEIKAIAELNTVTMYQELIIDSVTYVPSKIPLIVNPFTFGIQPILTRKELVLVVKGRVKAGINLQNLGDKNVFVKDDSVSLTLPHAVITDVFLNPSGIETFYENGEWSNEEVIAVKQSARRKLLQEADRQRLLQRADDKARLVLEHFLRAAKFTKITIRSR